MPFPTPSRSVPRPQRPLALGLLALALLVGGDRLSAQEARVTTGPGGTSTVRMSGGGLSRLGVGVVNPPPVLIEQLELPKGQGLVVESVTPDSPAARAGLRDRDLLLELGGKPVPNSPTEFAQALAELKAAGPLDVVVLRKGKRETLRGVTLLDAPTGPVSISVTQVGGGGRSIVIVDSVIIGRGVTDPGRGGGEISLERNGERFNAGRQVGAVNLVVSGKVVSGKVQVEEILAEEAGNVTRYPGVDQVPPALAPAVREIIRRVEISSGG